MSYGAETWDLFMSNSFLSFSCKDLLRMKNLAVNNFLLPPPVRVIQ